MSDDMPAHGRSSGAGRLLTGVAWAVLLLGLWLWGRDLTDVRLGIAAPTTGTSRRSDDRRRYGCHPR